MEGINTTLDKGGNGGGGEAAKLAVSITYAALKALRDGGNLVPGTWYRITDYHTTVSPLITDVRSVDDVHSAAHQFDVIVRADDGSHLNENAYAGHHSYAEHQRSDDYFAACKLEAWELKYSIDNEKFSLQSGTFIVEENDSYNLKKIGTVEVDGTTYILWDATELYEDYGLTRAVSEDEEIGTDLMKYDPETGEIDGDSWTSPIESKQEIEEEGKGTIYYMKDENGNQAPYDFKNIQFKRWLVTDSMSGRTGFTDKYLGVLNNLPEKLSIEDEDDFVWAYTFSSNSDGGEQEDYSMNGKDNSVYDNIIEESTDYVLPNNVFFGKSCFSNHLMRNCYQNSFSQGCSGNSFSQSCYQNSFSQNCRSNSFSQSCYQNSFSQNCSRNSFSQGCNNNSFSQGCSQNSFSQNCYNNSFSQGCSGNSFSQDCYRNSFSQSCYQNSFSQNCQNNSFSQSCTNNSFSQNCQRNSFSQYCSYNSFSQSCTNIHLFAGVQYCDVSGTGTGNPQNAQILSGMVGTNNSRLSVSIANGKSYTQVVGKNTSGQVKVWNPADLAQ